MSNYSAYCCGSCKGTKSAVSYLIFKDGQLLEERVIRTPEAVKSMSQHVLAIKYAVERLVELNVSDVVVNTSSQEAHDRILKSYKNYVLRKDSLPDGFEKSNIFQVSSLLSKFQSIKLNVIPLHENLRAQYLCRKFIVEGWQLGPLIWKNEFPVQS